MRALVTGGAGFIGSNLVDALVAHGGVLLGALSAHRDYDMDSVRAELPLAEIKKRLSRSLTASSSATTASCSPGMGDPRR